MQHDQFPRVLPRKGESVSIRALQRVQSEASREPKDLLLLLRWDDQYSFLRRDGLPCTNDHSGLLRFVRRRMFRRHSSCRQPHSQEGPPPPTANTIQATRDRHSQRPKEFPTVRLPSPTPVCEKEAKRDRRSLPYHPFVRCSSGAEAVGVGPTLMSMPMLVLFFGHPRRLSRIFRRMGGTHPSQLFLCRSKTQGRRSLPKVGTYHRVISRVS